MSRRPMVRSFGVVFLAALVAGTATTAEIDATSGAPARRVAPYPADRPSSSVGDSDAAVSAVAADIVGPAAGATATATAVRVRPSFPCGEQRVFVVGDSLTVGADYFGKLGSLLTTAGYLPRINAKESRFTSAGATILRDEALAGRLERVVVVALGTNDAAAGYSTTSFAANVDKVMTAVGPSRVVIWVNLQMKATTTRPYLGTATVNHNAVLTTKAGQYANLVIADWASTPNLVHLASDGIHYSSTGYRNRAVFHRDRLDVLTCRIAG